MLGWNRDAVIPVFPAGFPELTSFFPHIRPILMTNTTNPVSTLLGTLPDNFLGDAAAARGVDPAAAKGVLLAVMPALLAAIKRAADSGMITAASSHADVARVLLADARGAIVDRITRTSPVTDPAVAGIIVDLAIPRIMDALASKGVPVSRIITLASLLGGKGDILGAAIGAVLGGKGGSAAGVAAGILGRIIGKPKA